jgi:hypothetical protein
MWWPKIITNQGLWEKNRTVKHNDGTWRKSEVKQERIFAPTTEQYWTSKLEKKLLNPSSSPLARNIRDR